MDQGIRDGGGDYFLAEVRRAAYPLGVVHAFLRLCLRTRVSASVLAAGCAGLRATCGADPVPVSFSKEIAPILQQKCVTCHGPDKTKGGFQLHTFAALGKAGESKEPSLAPGQPQQSKVYRLLVASDPEDRMPQKDDPLPTNQIALIKRWIEEGARFDGPDPASPLVALAPPVAHPDPPEVYAHPVPISALAFSPNDRSLVAGGYHELTFWSVKDGTLLRRVKDIDQQTLALAYSPDGSLLAAAGGTPGRSGEVRLIDVRTGRASQPLVRIGDLVLALAFSPDGRTLAAGGADNVVRLLDVPAGRQSRRIEHHADWVTALAYHPDGSRLVSVSRDKTARLVDPANGELEETYTGHSQALFGVGLVPGGKLVITGGREKSLQVWQIKEAKKSFEISGFDAGVWRILMQSNDVFTCSADRLVRHHRLAEKKAELIRTYTGHRDVVYALAYDAASQTLASADYEGEVKIWNTTDGTLQLAFRAAPGSTAPAGIGK